MLLTMLLTHCHPLHAKEYGSILPAVIHHVCRPTTDKQPW